MARARGILNARLMTPDLVTLNAVQCRTMTCLDSTKQPARLALPAEFRLAYAWSSTGGCVLVVLTELRRLGGGRMSPSPEVFHDSQG
jgi:hypothetical protein